jgi:hypothetical protein
MNKKQIFAWVALVMCLASPSVAAPLPLFVEEVRFDPPPTFRTNYFKVEKRESFETESVLSVEIEEGKNKMLAQHIVLRFSLEVYAVIDPIRCYTAAMKDAAIQASRDKYEDTCALYEYRFAATMKRVAGRMYQHLDDLKDEIAATWDLLAHQASAFWQENRSHEIDADGFIHARPNEKRISHYRRNAYGLPSSF